MIQSPQTIHICRNGTVEDAVVSWRYENGGWLVQLTADSFDALEAHENDAFEALCTIRAQLEPLGWRIGVAGARGNVWPSGMARDQGGGLSAYRLDPGDEPSVVDTFEPVDPATVTTLDEQRAAAERLLG